MHLDFHPLEEPHVDVVEQWLDDAESRRRLGGMIPFRPCFEYQQRNSDYHAWIVYEAGLPIGLAGFEIEPDGTAAIVLLVQPRFRGRRYGRCMLTALCHRPEAKRARALIAPVEPDHDAAIRCLRAAGFVNRGIDPDDPEFFRFVL